MKGVFGLLFIGGGVLLAWLVILGKVHPGKPGSTSSASPKGSEPAPVVSESGPRVATPGSTTGGQQP